jgi:adhesin transport system membrane fusion protein
LTDATDATRRHDRDERAFAIEIRTRTNILDADGAALEILPGMVVEANILARRRTVLDYMTTPIVRVRDRALRE